MIDLKEKLVKFINKVIRSDFKKKRCAKIYRSKEIKKDDSWYLRIPDNIPQEILYDFSALFDKYKVVLFAYLAEGFLESDPPPHYIIGIKIDPEAKITIVQLIEKISKEMHEIIPKGFYVDIIELGDQKTPISDFMKDCLIPFYTRTVNS